MFVLTENGKKVVRENWERAEALVQKRVASLPYKVRLVVKRLLRQNPILAQRAIEAFDAGYATERIPQIITG